MVKYFLGWAGWGGILFFKVNVNVNKKLTNTLALCFVHREPTYDLYALVGVVGVGVNLPITLLIVICY